MWLALILKIQDGDDCVTVTFLTLSLLKLPKDTRVNAGSRAGEKKQRNFFPCLMPHRSSILNINIDISPQILKTNYGSETVIPLYITGCGVKIYSESAVVAKRRRLICAIYFLSAASAKEGYHILRAVTSLVSGLFLTLYGCREVQ